MRWSDLLRMSAGSLKRRKLRAFLTILGVVIGTTSIVVMISLDLDFSSPCMSRWNGMEERTP